MPAFKDKFRKDEDGAVTVDWVFLTAVLVGLAMVAIGTVKSNSEALGTNIGDKVKSYALE